MREAELVRTERGLVPKADGWFVLNARETQWWHFVHCPPGAKHTIVGAGTEPCLILAVGARDRSTGPEWGGYTVDEAALRHNAGVEQETTKPDEAYARFGEGGLVAYRDGWL